MLALSYIIIVYPRFCSDISFIWEHILVLTVWLTATLILMFLIREVLLRLHLRLIFLPAVVIPTLSCFLLFLIYFSAILCSITWGILPNYRTILPFIPHLFELAENFEIPP